MYRSEKQTWTGPSVPLEGGKLIQWTLIHRRFDQKDESASDGIKVHLQSSPSSWVSEPLGVHWTTLHITVSVLDTGFDTDV